MYCILVYDINTERIAKVYKLIKQFLNWTQNSTFEGEINTGSLNELKHRIQKIINQDEDSVVIYKLQSDYYLDKETMGKDKSKFTSFIL